MSWPWPGDSQLTIARRIAMAYRQHLTLANPQVCAALDDAMRDYGQTWILPTPAVYDDTDAVTTRVAAELAGVPEAEIRRWAARPHPDDPGRRLLPRFGWDGPSRTYLVRDVRDAAARVTARLVHRRRDTPDTPA